MQKLIVIIFLSSILGCGATQLYDGPRLPREQVVRVKSENSKIFIDKKSKSMWNEEVEVLPGAHHVDCVYTFDETPYNCSTFTDFNSYSYNDCISDQNKERDKNGYSSKTCSSCEFEEKKQRCSVPGFAVKCSAEITMQAGAAHTISCDSSKTYHRTGSGGRNYDYDGFMYLDSKQIGSCILEGPLVVEKEFSCGSGCGYHSCDY